MKIFLSIFLLFILLIKNSYCQSENIENSIEYIRKKASIKYTKIGNTIIREVFVNGFRVSDEYLASLSENKDLYNKIISEIYNRRIRNLFFCIIGLPLGSTIGYYANQENKIIYVDNKIFQNSTTLGFFLSTISVFISLYSIISLIDLLNDVTGVYKENFLTNSEAENIVNSYNLKLKNQIFQEKRINCLHCENNNIIILYIGKSF